MKPIFHTLIIKEIIKETVDTVSITFNVPNDLKSNFDYIQGQYLTLKTNINGEEVRRSYSICSAPSENKLQVAVKQVEQGVFSNFANNELKIGDSIEVMNPMGKFHNTIEPNQAKNYVAIAVGSGITPILSIIKETLLQEPMSTFTLIYGNKNTKSIIFKEQIEALKDKYIDRLTLHYILSRERVDVPLYFGRVDDEKCAIFFNKLIDLDIINQVFLCGPEDMILNTKALLEKKGFDKHKIHFELFTSSSDKKKLENVQKSTNDSHKSNISLKIDGKTMEFKLGFNENNILDAAMNQGADLPYACKGGVCCTCKAKLVSGEVEMLVNYGLEEDEIEHGYILTCQSYPKTDAVMVDFDA
jgi:ring-1,2-phenylacetyl-CoA epoxidase subunit PaaE